MDPPVAIPENDRVATASGSGKTTTTTAIPPNPKRPADRDADETPVAKKANSEQQLEKYQLPLLLNKRVSSNSKSSNSCKHSFKLNCKLLQLVVNKLISPQNKFR
jgi:hypothetical protein